MLLGCSLPSRQAPSCDLPLVSGDCLRTGAATCSPMGCFVIESSMRTKVQFLLADLPINISPVGEMIVPSLLPRPQCQKCRRPINKYCLVAVVIPFLCIACSPLRAFRVQAFVWLNLRRRRQVMYLSGNVITPAVEGTNPCVSNE